MRHEPGWRCSQGSNNDDAKAALTWSFSLEQAKGIGMSHGPWLDHGPAMVAGEPSLLAGECPLDPDAVVIDEPGQELEMDDRAVAC